MSCWIQKGIVTYQSRQYRPPKTGSLALASPVSERARTDFLYFLNRASRATPIATFTIDSLLNRVYSDQIIADIRTNVRIWTDLRDAPKLRDVYAAPTQHFQFISDRLKRVLPDRYLAEAWQRCNVGCANACTPHSNDGLRDTWKPLDHAEIELLIFKYLHTCSKRSIRKGIRNFTS